MHILYPLHTDSQTAALNFGKATFRMLSTLKYKEMSSLFYNWSWDSVVGVAARIRGSTLHSSIPDPQQTQSEAYLSYSEEVL
jgi:hypothetical protein